MSAGEKYLTREAKLAEVDLACDVNEEDGKPLENSLSNGNENPELNKLTSLNTLDEGPAARAISLPTVLCPIKEDKLDDSAVLSLPLASVDRKHEHDNLTSLGELGVHIDNSATELVSCPGVLCLTKDEHKISAAIADDPENLPSSDERQGENVDSSASESDFHSSILFLGSELENFVSQDQNTRMHGDILIRESQPDRSSILDGDKEESQDDFFATLQLSADHEDGRFRTLSSSDEPRRSYNSLTENSLAHPSTLCLVSELNDPPTRPSFHDLSSQLHESLSLPRSAKRKMDIPDSESLTTSASYLAADPRATPDLPLALCDEEDELNNILFLDEPRSSLGQPSVVFLTKSRTLPNNSTSFMESFQFETESQPKFSKWASIRNRLIGPPFLGPRVTNTRVPDQFSGHEAGSLKEKDSSHTSTLLGALDLEVPKKNKLMSWSRIKQAMVGKKNCDKDQENNQDGGHNKGDKGKGNRGKPHSRRMFGLGWMQKGFSVMKNVEEVQETKPTYPVDTYNTILDREM